MDFEHHGGLAPLTPAFLKGEMYFNVNFHEPSPLPPTPFLESCWLKVLQKAISVCPLLLASAMAVACKTHHIEHNTSVLSAHSFYKFGSKQGSIQTLPLCVYTHCT